MPFGMDTRVVLSNTVLDRDLGPPQDGEIWGSKLETPSSQRCRLSPKYFGLCLNSFHEPDGSLCPRYSPVPGSYRDQPVSRL